MSKLATLTDADGAAAGGIGFHWFCCQENCNRFHLIEEPTRNEDYNNSTNACECCHIRCENCRVWWIKEGEGTITEEIASSNNLLDKLRSDLKNQTPLTQTRFAWRCCYCMEGPFGLLDPEATKETREEGAWPAKCLNVQCHDFQENREHEICSDCLIYTCDEDDVGNFKWRLTDSSKQKLLNNLERSLQWNDSIRVEIEHGAELNQDVLERKQFGLRDMIIDGSDLLQDDRILSMQQLLSDSIVEPSLPTNSNLILSSESSPTETPEPNFRSHVLDQSTTNSHELHLILKKSECRARLEEAKKKVGVNQNPDGALYNAQTFSFLLAWEHAILPFLIEFMPTWHGPGYTIGLRREKDLSSKAISIMTEKEMPDWCKTEVEKHTLELLPLQFHDATSFEFRRLSVHRLNFNYDDICEPNNPHYYGTPVMGDSIGPAIGQGDDDSTSTLGPHIMLEGMSYSLMNFHPLWKASRFNKNNPNGLKIEHPSPADRIALTHANKNFKERLSMGLGVGSVVATSGSDLTTTRVSNNLYWKELGLNNQEIVVDWALLSAAHTQLNELRFPHSIDNKHPNPVLSTGQPKGGEFIHSTGRTSGFQRGQVCLSPAAVDGKINGTGKITREWYVEEPYPYGDEAGWTKSGIGVPGDSGAVIVDAELNTLYGQLWGRDEYMKGASGQRITFFTPIEDLFEDIKEKFHKGLPSLPQLHQITTPTNPQSKLTGCLCCYNPPNMSPSGQELPEPGIITSTLKATGSLTPMTDLMTSEEMTPSEEELLTPESIRSPQCYRDHRLLFDHTGPPLQYPWINTPKTIGETFCSPVMTPIISEHGASYPDEIDSDDFLSSGSDGSRRGTKRKNMLAGDCEGKKARFS